MRRTILSISMSLLATVWGTAIVLQMHPGPPMKVQFKDLRIKVFK